MNLLDYLQNIDTPRCVLRPLGIEDAPAFHRIYSDSQTMTYWSDEPARDQAQSKAMVQADLDWVADGHALLWAVVAKDSGQVLGKWTLFNHHAANRRAEIGYILNRSYWGNGLMTEVCSVMLDYCFDRIKLHRVEADADEGNAASMALLEKLGFVREGYFPERWWTGGQWTNSVMYGLLARHWRQRRAGLD